MASQKNIFDRHQIKIAKRTLRLSDAGAICLGGMTKLSARIVLRTKAGWSKAKVDRYEAA